MTMEVGKVSRGGGRLGAVEQLGLPGPAGTGAGPWRALRGTLPETWRRSAVWLTDEAFAMTQVFAQGTRHSLHPSALRCASEWTHWAGRQLVVRRAERHAPSAAEGLGKVKKVSF